jgi:hypothetical protein
MAGQRQAGGAGRGGNGVGGGGGGARGGGGSPAVPSLTAAQIKALNETKKFDKEDIKRAKVAAGKVVVKPKPKPNPNPNPNPTQRNVPNPIQETVESPGVSPATPTPAPVTSTPVQLFDPNVYTVYKKEIERLTLKLVNRAKSLLLAYDFSSIDRIADYRLEGDNGARGTDVISTPQVPQSPSTSIITAQETATALINEISNKISDNVPLETKLDLFGSDVNGRFVPRKVGISNGLPNYDLNFTVHNVSPQIKNIIIRCYEIS